MLTDYYKVLQVPRDADAAMLRAAYRRLAKTAHPDARPGLRGAAREAQARRFILLAQAYRVLGDPVQRRAHDRALGPAETVARPPGGRGARPHAAGSAPGQADQAPHRGPEPSLDDLLREVDDLLGRFGLDLRSPVERTLEALLDWARGFYAEVLAAWREEGQPPRAGKAGAGPAADPQPGGRAESPRPTPADVEAELARIKRTLRRKPDPEA